jgi:hypothetical protein
VLLALALSGASALAASPAYRIDHVSDGDRSCNATASAISFRSTPRGFFGVSVAAEVDAIDVIGDDVGGEARGRGPART